MVHRLIGSFFLTGLFAATLPHESVVRTGMSAEDEATPQDNTCPSGITCTPKNGGNPFCCSEGQHCREPDHDACEY